MTDRSKTRKQFYEESYERSAEIPPLIRDGDFLYGQVLEEIRPYAHAGLRVLDLGCNTGVLSFYLASLGCRVQGIDLASNAIETARQGVMAHGFEDLQFASMDFQEDWKQAEAFDLVICLHVIEHVDDDRGLIMKLEESLAPGGKVIIAVPSEHSSQYRFFKWLRGEYRFDNEVGHLRRYDIESLRALLRGTAFVEERWTPLDGPIRDWLIINRWLRVAVGLVGWGPIGRFLNRLDSWMAARVWPATIVLHARKS